MKRIATALFVTILLTGGAACTKKEADEALVTATTVAATSDTTTGSRTSDTTTKSDSDGGSTDTTVKRSAPDSGDGGCPTAEEATSVSESFDVFDPTAPSFDPAKLKASVEQAMALIEKYLPSSLQGDLVIVRGAITQFVEAMQGIDISNPASVTPEQMKKLEEITKAMSSPEVKTAMDNIADYFNTNCPDSGLDLNS